MGSTIYLDSWLLILAQSLLGWAAWMEESSSSSLSSATHCNLLGCGEDGM